MLATHVAIYSCDAELASCSNSADTDAKISEKSITTSSAGLIVFKIESKLSIVLSSVVNCTVDTLKSSWFVRTFFIDPSES